MTTQNNPNTPEPILPKEGWHVLHQYYRVNRTAWDSLPLQTQAANLEIFRRTVHRIRETKDTQLLLFSAIGVCDWGFLLITPNLHDLDVAEKQLFVALGSGVLERFSSHLSLTEESEYATTVEEYEATLEKEGLVKDSEPFREKVASWQATMAKYRHERVYPTLGPWKAICFYPMLKRRHPSQNWYALSYEKRRELMAGHARVGRKYAGRVKQLITGATGLSDWEWGVTLFANDLAEIKSIVYEMRFDEVSHTYGEFGPFLIGAILETAHLLERILPLVRER